MIEFSTFMGLPIIVVDGMAIPGSVLSAIEMDDSGQVLHLTRHEGPETSVDVSSTDELRRVYAWARAHDVSLLVRRYSRTGSTSAS